MRIRYLPKALAFIENLDPTLGARANKTLDLLMDRGHTLRMPFSKSVEDGFFELRVIGAVHIRLLYFFHQGEAVVVHAFLKQTPQLNRKDIDYAQRARSSFIAGT